MKHLLIDYENIQPESLALIEEPENYHIWIFLGIYQQRVLAYPFVKSLLSFNSQHIHFIEMQHLGKDALDHYLSFYLGKISEVDSHAEVYILARDSGYEVLIHHLNQTYQLLNVRRITRIEAIAKQEFVAIDDNTGQNKIKAVVKKINKEQTQSSATRSTIIKPRNTLATTTENSLALTSPPTALPKKIDLKKVEKNIPLTFIYYCFTITLRYMMQEDVYLPKRILNLYSAIKKYALAYELRDLDELEVDYLIRKVVEKLQKQGLMEVEDEVITYKLSVQDFLNATISHILTTKPRDTEDLKNSIKQKLMNLNQPDDADEVELIIDWLTHKNYIRQQGNVVIFATDDLNESDDYKMAKNFILQTPKLLRPTKVKPLHNWLKSKLKMTSKKDVKELIKSLQDNKEIIINDSGKITYNF